MAPAALTTANVPANGTSLKATAPSFHPTGTPDPSAYHSASTEEAIDSEHTHAAHNYHPLPIVFSRASGVSVWDPEGMLSTEPNTSILRSVIQASSIWIFYQHMVP